ncbi:hypothetical protein J7I98_18015 [Streptomyces sp. ISL-98]|uniref:hypothetical protein n=1 Tax=Streptomyces sp. ISL-98 TaxID=2819192 RepID=UPI001BE94475|nr:hypothetical protein [Streptomyces sp. ISL-98]MBT2507743.1 hypothetical protein [Streptomyces sp. ISL-98]
MTRGHRFHVDQHGHSVSVQLGRPAAGIEVLVDGKVVAYRPGRAKGVTILAAELPEEPPRPFRVLVEDMGGTPFCVMDTAGSTFLMPQVPLTSRHESPHLTSSDPVRRLRRILRRIRIAHHGPHGA